MTSLREVLARFRGLFGQARLERRMDEEFEFHMHSLTERFVREGMSTAEARAAAKREFGHPDDVRERYRRQRGIPMIETIMRDARFGVRNLLRSPVFTVTALGSLVLGIGANTAIFSVINATLLTPLPYPESARIVQVVRELPDYDMTSHDRRQFSAVEENITTIQHLAAIGSSTGLNLVAGDEAEYVTASPVSLDYFDVLSVQPQLGRSFFPEEDIAGGPDVAILSHALWTRLLDSDRNVIGRTINLSDAPYTVVGVMSPDFQSIPGGDLWVPLRPATNGMGGGYNYRIIGRLAPGTEFSQVQTELTSLSEGLHQTDPGVLDESTLGFRSYSEIIAGDVRSPLLILFGAVGIVLLIACANVANLILARSLNRSRELAVRAALGASRRRLLGQLLTESIVMALMAGSIGLGLAWLVAPWLMNLSPAAAPWREVTLDATVVGATLVASVLTGILFGLVPALTLSSSQGTALRDDGFRNTGSSKASWLRQSLVVVEVALSVVLLFSATLLLKSFANLRSVELGFVPDNLVTAQMSLSGPRFQDPETARRFYDRGLRDLEALPEVASAAVVSGLPVESGLNLPVTIVGDPRPDNGRLQTDYRYVSSDYFDVMGIEVVNGRAFSESDIDGSQQVAVVNEEFVRRYLTEGTPLNREIAFGWNSGDGQGEAATLRVVGVTRDLQERGIGGRSVAVVYVPVAQAAPAGMASTHYFFPVSWVVRTRSGSAGIADQIREVLRGVDPLTPVSRVRTMGEIISRSLAVQQFQTVLLSVFSLMAVVLAAAGIYGIMAFTVSSRIREIGIRIALGATAPRVLGLIVRTGLVVVAIGAVAGIAGSIAFATTLDSFVFGIDPNDPLTIATVVAVLFAVSLFAAILPAVRAMRQDPVQTLRTE